MGGRLQLLLQQSTIRLHVGKGRVREKGVQYEGLRCDEAGWVDIMEFLQYSWIFDHEKVMAGDDGIIRAEFEKQGKIRLQLLCIVLDSSYTEPDEHLKQFLCSWMEMKTFTSSSNEMEKFSWRQVPSGHQALIHRVDEISVLTT